LLESIRTIDDLTRALKGDGFDIVQHYLNQVTVQADIEDYLLWLYDNEVTTDIVAKLRRERTRALGIHPSSASKVGVCLLKLYYECTHEVPPGSAYNQKSQLTWDIGTLLHETCQQWFRDMYGDQFQSEVSLKNDDGTICSHTDGIFSFTYYKFILEIKSIKEGGNYGWEKVQSKPQVDHVRQAHFYMKLSNTPYALVLYLNKNAGEFKEHAVYFNQSIWDDLQNNVIDPVVSAAYKKGPRVPAKPGWHCKWCAFQHGCPEKRRGTVDHAKW